ncbi:MAG: PEGA domain-containing protein [Methanoregula sp.]
MSYPDKAILCCLMLACCSFFLCTPAHAFTANSLDITIDKNGDAIATFRFTLEGILENSIPLSLLEEELKKGLTTGTESPEIKSMDTSGVVLLLKNFAEISDVPTGTEYSTSALDFTKAELALQNSGLSGAISADFSPEKIVLTFPDSYQQEFSNVDVLPSVSHTVEDPAKRAARAQAQVSPGATAGAGIPVNPAPGGSINVTSSPQGVKVYLDSRYIGEAPAVFPDIAPGTHTAEFRKDGFASLKRNVTIFEGKTTNIRVVLEYIPPATPEESSSFPGFVLPVVIVVLIAIAGGGYYYWNKNMKTGEEEEEDTQE